MLYHVPDPRRAAAEFARVLRPGGVLLAATNGPRHLDAVAEVSRAVLGWSSLDFVDKRFGQSTGEEILRTAFGSVTWHLHPSTMICTDPADVLAFIASSPAGQDATPEQRRGARGGRGGALRRGGRADDDHEGVGLLRGEGTGGAGGRRVSPSA